MSVNTVGTPRGPRHGPHTLTASHSYSNMPIQIKADYITKQTDVSKKSTDNLPTLPKSQGSKRAISPTSENLVLLLKRLMLTDNQDHEKRALVLNALYPFVTQSLLRFSTASIDLFYQGLAFVMEAPPPYAEPSVYYKIIVFPAKRHTTDISYAYGILQKLIPVFPKIIPPRLIKALVRRLSSASVSDRETARDMLISLDSNLYFPIILSNITSMLVPPPVHGMIVILETITKILDGFPQNDPKLPTNPLFTAIKLIHFASHYATFFDPLINVLKSLFKRNENYAIEMRLFLLNHWPVEDPPKCALFMKEAKKICKIGPPVDFDVWQKYSSRASSIYMPVAIESLKFIKKTIPFIGNNNIQEIRYLVEAAAEEHWCDIVQEEAQKLLPLLPPAEPLPPKKIPINTWIDLREIAKQNYPEETFSRARGRKPR